MIEFEFKQSSTGSYSPWHLDIAKNYGVPLMCTADMAQFVKIGDDIYKITRDGIHGIKQDLCDYLEYLKKQNESGKFTDEETIARIKNITDDPNNRFGLKKCYSLDEFEKEIKELKSKQDAKH